MTKTVLFAMSLCAMGIGLTVVTGCGSPGKKDGSGTGGTSGGATSGVSPTKRIDTLTDAEKNTLCDWDAQKSGGYGHVVQCGEGLTLEADESQAACRGDFPTTCPATVSQYEKCVTDASCNDPIPSSCDYFFTCTFTNTGV